jgi:hypothetical protein
MSKALQPIDGGPLRSRVDDRANQMTQALESLAIVSFQLALSRHDATWRWTTSAQALSLLDGFPYPVYSKIFPVLTPSEFER